MKILQYIDFWIFFRYIINILLGSVIRLEIHWKVTNIKFCTIFSNQISTDASESWCVKYSILFSQLGIFGEKLQRESSQHPGFNLSKIQLLGKFFQPRSSLLLRQPLFFTFILFSLLCKNMRNRGEDKRPHAILYSVHTCSISPVSLSRQQHQIFQFPLSLLLASHYFLSTPRFKIFRIFHHYLPLTEQYTKLLRGLRYFFSQSRAAS